MIILRLKSSGMGLVNNLFICIGILGVLCDYMLNGALYVTWSYIWGGVIAKFPKFRETNDSGWL